MQPMSCVNGLPHVTKSVDEGCSKIITPMMILNNIEEALFESNVRLSSIEFF